MIYAKPLVTACNSQLKAQDLNAARPYPPDRCHHSHQVLHLVPQALRTTTNLNIVMMGYIGRLELAELLSKRYIMPRKNQLKSLYFYWDIVLAAFLTVLGGIVRSFSSS